MAGQAGPGLGDSQAARAGVQQAQGGVAVKARDRREARPGAGRLPALPVVTGAH
jgi:hypothetical protein